MHKIKKSTVAWCIAAILLLGLCSFFLVTGGSIREHGGLPQNSRITIKNAYVQDNTLYYTLENRSLRETIPYGAVPRIERKNDTAWEKVALWGEKQPLIACTTPAFTQVSFQHPITYHENLTPGEYRIFYGDSSTPYYIVGYFTIAD